MVRAAVAGRAPGSHRPLRSRVQLRPALLAAVQELGVVLLAAGVAHTPEGEEVLRGARMRAARKPGQPRPLLVVIDGKGRAEGGVINTIVREELAKAS